MRDLSDAIKKDLERRPLFPDYAYLGDPRCQAEDEWGAQCELKLHHKSDHMHTVTEEIWFDRYCDE